MSATVISGGKGEERIPVEGGQMSFIRAVRRPICLRSRNFHRAYNCFDTLPLGSHYRESEDLVVSVSRLDICAVVSRHGQTDAG